MLRRILLVVFVAVAALPASAADWYLASRCNSRIEVQHGGTLRVTETIASSRQRSRWLAWPH